MKTTILAGLEKINTRLMILGVTEHQFIMRIIHGYIVRRKETEKWN